jgi:LmbE family N-acetylglucosaminyl deacetylase
MCGDAQVHLTVAGFPDGRLPLHWSEVKSRVAEFRRTCEPDLVIGPQRHDAHQDHRLLAELTPTEFRDHLTLGYEILKWEADTPSPNVFHPVDTTIAEEKARLLHKHYPSQTGRDWFDEDAFLGLSRLRGVKCRSAHAEAFTV